MVIDESPDLSGMSANAIRTQRASFTTLSSSAEKMVGGVERDSA